MITTKLTRDRSTMILRPNRSARRPQKGASMAVSAGVTPRLNPDHIATRPRSETPSRLKYSGRNGITSVKPMKPMNDADVTAKRFLRYDGTSEPNPHHPLLLHVNSVDEADAGRIALHDDGAR